MKKILIPLFPAMAYLMTRHQPSDLSWCAVVMALVASLWIMSSLPLHLTGLVGVVLMIVKQPANIKNHLAPFADPIIFLFMAGFFLAKAIEVHQLDRWISYKVLSLKQISANPAKAMIMITLLTFIFSSFLSNAATAALFIPLGVALLKDEPPHHHHLLLLISAAATIGGLTTPMGSAPNLIAIGVMEKMTGLTFPFYRWVMIMFPLALIYLLLTFLVFKPELTQLKNHAKAPKFTLAPLASDQIKILVILSLAMIFWFLPSLFDLALPETTVALVMALSLFIIPSRVNARILNWDQAVKIDWGTLLLFGSGLSLAQSMHETGLSQLMTAFFSFLTPYPLWVVLFLIILCCLFLTELTSNTALTNIITPILLSIPRLQAHPYLVVVIVILAVNLAFMLPVGTPPNAMVFATGKIPKKVMFKKGLILNALSVIYIFLISLLSPYFF